MERNRFISATPETAAQYLEYQSNRAVDAIYTVKEFPWIYTAAGRYAEAASHWAFIVMPELRVDDRG